MSILLLCLTISRGQAQLSITTANTPVIQNFDALPQSGTTNAATGSIFSNGWSFLEAGSNGNTTYSAGTGSSTTGDTWSFGIAGTNAVGDRAFGVLQSGNLSSILGFQFTNNTGTTITSLQIGYTGEEWRKAAAADALAFSYQSGTVALNAATGWAVVTGLGFTTPVTGTAAILDGNATANRTVISPVTITGLSIANGTTYTLRWVDATGASSAAMAIDDFTITLVSSPSSPTVTTTAASAINTTTASSGGIISATGGSPIISEGVIWNTSSGVTTALSTKTSDGTATPFTSSITPLIANTKYYYNAYATNSVGTSYGIETNFTTLSNPPVIGSGTAPTASGFTANWSAPATQGTETFTYTVDISTDNMFGTINQTLTGISSATLSTAITGLSSSTTYYYRVKAVNITGSSLYSATSSGVLTSTIITPTITVSGTLSALTTIYGTASPTTTFTASGSGLTNDIIVTAPAGFEISVTAGSGYATSLTLAQSAGGVPNTTIYVRLAATTAAGTYTGNVVLTSTGAAPVNVATVSSTVTQKALTITGLSATGRPYNATATAALGGTPVLNGVIAGDNVTLGGTVSSLFADKNVGTSKPVTVAGYTIGGSSSANYTLTQPTGLTATITAVSLTVTGATANNKVYDGTTVATLSGGTLVGVINPDVVTFNGTGTFANANVGTWAVTSTSTLTGADAGNYTLSQPTGLMADITPGTCSALTTGSIGWNFTAGTAAASSNTVSNLSVSVISSGNNNTAPTPFINNTSPSNLYSGFSAGNNAGAAAYATTFSSASTYFQFTLTPSDPTARVSLTSFQFGTRSTTTGPANYSIRSSLDNYTTDLATGSIPTTSTWTLETNSTILNNIGAAGASVTYRIYGYNGIGTPGPGTANWRVDDISLSVSLTTAALLTSSTTATICSGVPFTYTPTSTVSPATYPWTRAVVAGISNAAGSGSGNISETLVNTTNSPINVIYNYTINGTNCSNPNQNVTVTVNPAPNLTNFSTTAITPVNSGTSSSVTINSTSLAAGTYTVTYNLSGTNTATGATASVTFSGGIGSFATANLTNPGSTTVTIASVANATCSSSPASNNTAVINVINTTIVINSLSASAFCVTSSSAPVSITFTSAGTYNSGNIYTAQLSDATGSFTTSVNIGSLSSVSNTGIISAAIPTGTIAGNAYRIRVVASNPVTTGLDNGSDLIISNGPVITIDATNASVFVGNTANFSVVVTNAASYQWQISTDNGATWANVTTGTGGTTASYTTPATTVSMTGNQYRCQITGASPCATLTATSAAATLTVNTAASIWTNPITGTSPDPSVSNPFTSGDVTDPGLTVSGITRSAALSPNAGTNRYNATNWPLTSTIDATKYFLFTLTPNTGYHINFLNFVYTGQHSPTGTQNFSIRSSLDGFASDISTLSSPNGSGSVNIGATVNLATAAFQNITSAITFRFYAWNATSTSGTFSINDFTFNGSVDPNCTPTKLIFSNTIANPSQDVVIPTFKVSIACASNTVITSCSNGTITLTSTGCGLKGTLTKPVVNGVAIFDDISFDRSTQTALSFTGTYAGTCGAYTPAVSNNFDVTFTGAGIPVVTILKNENFDGSTPAWAYGIGTASLTNAGAPGGADVTGPKNFGAPNNNSISKSYSQDNSSGKQGSTNTITFNNVTGLAIYNSVKFSFQVGSLPVGTTGTGAGADNGEYMYIETSIDGGATWKKTLTNNGLGDHAFNLSATSPVSLAYDANAIYSSGNSLWFQSAFTITLPPGTDQFMFRMTANNNRTNENWVLDNLLLQGTTNGTGTQKPLPVATAYDIMACPGSSNTISFSVANGAGTLTYLWTPNTSISSTTINNPVVNPMATITYTGVASDTDKCTTSANVTVTVPSGAAGTWTGTASKDYFNCLNWANGVVPTATTDVTVTSTTNTVEMDATSPFAAAFSSTGTVNNISITSNNINFITGTEKLTIGGNLSLNSGSNINMTNGGLVNIAGNWDNSGGGNLTGGTGTVNYNGAAQNIGLETYHHLTLSGSGIKTAPAGILIVQGDLVRSGSASFNANGGTVLLNGITQSFSGLLFNNLALTNGTKTTAGSSIIADSIKLNDGTALSVSNGDSITIQSNATKTAHVGQIGTGTINYNATGKFVVERYIPARKAWRFLAIPTNTTQKIKEAWQEGATNTASNPKPGYGIQITDDKTATWSANGFDAYSLNGPSMKTYNPAPADNYTGVPSTNGTTFNISLGGYMTFIRGNRTSNTFSSPVTSTVLRTIGALYTGNQSPIIVTAGKITPQNNPFAASISLSKLSTSTSIFFYVWDPNYGGSHGFGIFQTFYWDGTKYATVLPNIGSYGSSNDYIESGQAFFVSGASASVPLTENAKTFGAMEPSPFRLHNASSDLRINLYKADNGETVLADAVLNEFSGKYTNAVNDYDALKLGNFSENLSILKDGRKLVIKRSFTPQLHDTIFLNLSSVSQKQYTFELVPFNFGHTGLDAYLEDHYLQKKLLVSLTDTTHISFVVNNDKASFAADRFDIVFDVAAGALPVTLTTVKAIRQNAFINVQWAVENESGIKQYIVEKSADGNIFSAIGSVPAVNVGAYNYKFTDEHPFAGINYYRVKIIDINGVISYSIIVKVVMTLETPRITIYPNPITDGQIHLQFTNEPTGKYGIRLLNKIGQLITQKQVTHEEGSSTELIKWDFTVAHGLYQLEVTRPDGTVKNVNIIY